MVQVTYYDTTIFSARQYLKNGFFCLYPPRQGDIRIIVKQNFFIIRSLARHIVRTVLRKPGSMAITPDLKNKVFSLAAHGEAGAAQPQKLAQLIACEGFISQADAGHIV